MAVCVGTSASPLPAPGGIWCLSTHIREVAEFTVGEDGVEPYVPYLLDLFGELRPVSDTTDPEYCAATFKRAKLRKNAIRERSKAS